MRGGLIYEASSPVASEAQPTAAGELHQKAEAVLENSNVLPIVTLAGETGFRRLFWRVFLFRRIIFFEFRR
jgi:hypothetical protein